jgi:hypothetical protein
MLDARTICSENFSVELASPISIFEIKDFLSGPDYQELRDDFPDKERFSSSHEGLGDKLYMNNRQPQFHELLKHSPTWREFYQRFADPEIIGGLYELTQTRSSDRSWRQRRPWRLVVDPHAISSREEAGRWSTRARGILGGYTPVRLAVELSYLENGCYIPPHTDSTKKLISLMYYLPDDGVDYGTSAGTEFYRGKAGERTRRAWKVRMLAREAEEKFFEHHEPYYAAQFEPNKLVGFIKSATSWHGLRKLVLPPGATRRSVNINYYVL